MGGHSDIQEILSKMARKENINIEAEQFEQ
jgi:hypothetical protein